jgi:tripartite motif-containing protein 71
MPSVVGHMRPISSAAAAAASAAFLLLCSTAVAAVDPVTTFGTSGSGLGELDSPAQPAISLDSGEILVADTVNHRFQRFSAAGVAIDAFGVSGLSGPGTFDFPHGLAIDPADGAVYVSDFTSETVQKFLFVDGAWEHQLTIIDVTAPVSLAVDPTTRDLYVAQSTLHQVARFAANGTSQGVFVGGIRGAGDGQFDSTQGVAVDPSTGAVYVADYLNDRVQ